MGQELLLVASPQRVHPKIVENIDVQPRFMGRLQGFGLGAGKITSNVENTEIPELLNRLQTCLVPVGQDGYSACIDGRRALSLLSGKPAPVRVRKAGGTIAPFAATCIGEGPLFKTFEGQSAQGIYERVGQFQTVHGKPESGHVDEFGPSCGAANGAEAHADAIVHKASVMLPILPTLLPEFASNLAEDHAACVKGAANFRDLLHDSQWDGPTIVEQAGKRNPDGIEVLRAEHNELHGHTERGLLIVDAPGLTFSEKLLHEHNLGEWFVWNLDETKDDARLEAIDEATYRRLCVAGVLNHLGVAHNLAASTMPVFFFCC